jgi:hypothetical protein
VLEQNKLWISDCGFKINNSSEFPISNPKSAIRIPKSYSLHYTGFYKTKFSFSGDMPIIPDLFGAAIKLCYNSKNASFTRRPYPLDFKPIKARF